MAYSPSHSTPNAPLPDRPRGPRLAHVAATVNEVCHLIETTLMSYTEIEQRTGVPRGTIWNWARDGTWMRPGFAPRSTRTVPTWRAGRARRRRMLALRLVALIERTLRRLESPSAVDAAKLREVRALLAAAQRATQTPRQRLLAAVRPLPDPKPRAPVKTVARPPRRTPRTTPDRAVDHLIEDARPDGAPRHPHPGAIRRERAPLSPRK